MTRPLPGGVTSVGYYWHHDTWNLARSAYIADLDTDPDAPDSFIGWLQHALRKHVNRTPVQRATLAERQPSQDHARGFNKAHPLPSTLVEAIEDAIIDDRRTLGRVLSRSGFLREAINAAAAHARTRLGHDLPPPPDRLPTRPPRRQPGLVRIDSQPRLDTQRDWAFD